MNSLQIMKTTHGFPNFRSKSVLLIRPCTTTNFEGLKFNKNISTDVFVPAVKNISNIFIQRIRELSAVGYESKTLEKLFTSKYTPKRRFNEQGYPVTTIIDKETGEPVEAYIKQKKLGNDNKRIFQMYVEDNYVGLRTFDINMDLKQIEPGFIVVREKTKYAGIGFRCHQLSVEEAIINGCDAVCIESYPQSVNFHTKSLYLQSSEKKITMNEYNKMVEDLVKKTQFSQEEAIKYLPYKVENDIVILPWEIVQENIQNLTQQKINTCMELSGERLKLWQDMAKSQPILLP